MIQPSSRVVDRIGSLPAGAYLVPPLRIGPARTTGRGARTRRRASVRQPPVPDCSATTRSYLTVLDTTESTVTTIFSFHRHTNISGGNVMAVTICTTELCILVSCTSCRMRLLSEHGTPEHFDDGAEAIDAAELAGWKQHGANLLCADCYLSVIEGLEPRPVVVPGCEYCWPRLIFGDPLARSCTCEKADEPQYSYITLPAPAALTGGLELIRCTTLACGRCQDPLGWEGINFHFPGTQAAIDYARGERWCVPETVLGDIAAEEVVCARCLAQQECAARGHELPERGSLVNDRVFRQCRQCNDVVVTPVVAGSVL